MPESGKAQNGSGVGPDPCQQEDKLQRHGLAPQTYGERGAGEKEDEAT